MASCPAKIFVSYDLILGVLGHSEMLLMYLK
jgi:hypothetical protein